MALTRRAAGGALDKAIAIYTRSCLIVVHLYRQLVGDGQLGNTMTLYPSLEPSTPHELRRSIQDQPLRLDSERGRSSLYVLSINKTSVASGV